MDLMSGLVAGIGVAAMVQTLLVWRATRALARLAALDARVERFGDALTLLTDTTESAFRAVAAEMTRLPAPERAAGPTARTRRIARAATRGASVQQIAAAEEVAEGEVLLRLQMANDQRGRRPGKPAAKAAAAVRKSPKAKEATRGALQLD